MSTGKVVGGVEWEPAVEVNDEFGELLLREYGLDVIEGVVVSDVEGSSWGPLDLDVREAFPVRHSPVESPFSDLTILKLIMNTSSGLQNTADRITA